MRIAIVLSSVLISLAAPAVAQVSVSIGLPGLSIGVNVPVYPHLLQVPGYPVYYAPRLQTNFFFYDGLYWVYQSDDWYASDWYDGPWSRVTPQAVPLYILRVPVRYYRSPPAHFRGWRSEAPPRWGEHWGNDWQQQRPGWDRWNRSAVPAPAPLPTYQRRYPAERYPQPEQQQTLRRQNYGYQPREPIVRQHFQEQPVSQAPQPRRRDQQDASPAQRPPPPGQAERRPEPTPEQGRAPGRGQQPQKPPRRDQDEKEPGKGKDKDRGDERDRGGKQ